MKNCDYSTIKFFKNLVGFKTVRFVKLLHGEINLGEWVLEIFKQCNFGEVMVVNLGISFTAGRKLQDQPSDVQYMYCPKSAASFNERFYNRDQAYKWAESLKGLDNPMEIMTLCFLFNDFGEFFHNSGWTGRRPIAAHLWIQK